MRQPDDEGTSRDFVAKRLGSKVDTSRDTGYGLEIVPSGKPSIEGRAAANDHRMRNPAK
jgi:hypothetical protein